MTETPPWATTLRASSWRTRDTPTRCRARRGCGRSWAGCSRPTRMDAEGMIVEEHRYDDPATVIRQLELA
ncbi:hypothetical protein [Kocuria sp.]|uniref:hypothetical protein n=1 Tax=Kocuria sp. TaxID=1871328 RepID=UPI002810C63E|nr:hypothetical protein [Kocuria sp.]